MKHAITIILILILPVKLLSQEWEVSEDKQQRLAPFAFSSETVAAGEAIFNTNCISCHGNPGQGNYQQFNPAPGDPAKEKIQSNTDGSIFYKVYEGRGLMPSFRNILTQDEIWQVVSYIRSFNESYIQQIAVVQKLENVRWSLIRILLNLKDEERKIEAHVTGLENDEWTPVPNTEIMLTVERYFGQMQIDEPKTTDGNGYASFTYPENLRADTSGNVRISSMLTDQDLFGNISTDTVFNTGLKIKRKAWLPAGQCGTSTGKHLYGCWHHTYQWCLRSGFSFSMSSSS